LAIVAPVVNETAASLGRPSRSRNHVPAVSSRATTPGVGDRMPAFWSHALTSQSAASAAGRVPPMTHPKNRPDWIAMSPGSTVRTMSSTTSVGSLGASGSPPSSAARSGSTSVCGPTGRRSSDPSHSRAEA
jgi:hypothetical protein